MSRRVQYFDIARGIAMICIVLGHLGQPAINHVVFTFHVPVFYLITGYFLKSGDPWKSFLHRRCRTLLVPYAVTCLAIIAAAAVFTVLIPGEGSTRGAVLKWLQASIYGAGDSYETPFHIPMIGALWFLLATFWGSCFLRLLLPLRPRARMAGVLLLFAAGYWSRGLFWFPFSLQAGMCAALFMYMGHLFRDLREPLSRLPAEIKACAVLLALGVWICFIRDFRSFWLVHCDVGRGAVDIFGSLCGCGIVLLLSRLIERKCRLLTRALAFLGRYSVIVLCAHIVELDVFPWWRVLHKLTALGMPEDLELYAEILLKFLWILPVTLLLSRWSLTRRLFGFPADRKTP